MKKGHINLEIKAKCSDLERIKKIIISKNGKYLGCDHQVDTYFKVSNGRLKIREGNIENNLIFYKRTDKKGPKQSNVIMLQNIKESPINDILKKSLDCLIKIDKKRDIFFIGNIKFHLDKVKGLGSFVEIEAIDYNNNIGKKTLINQVNTFLKLFYIKKEDLISDSYSDLLLQNKV